LYFNFREAAAANEDEKKQKNQVRLIEEEKKQKKQKLGDCRVLLVKLLKEMEVSQDKISILEKENHQLVAERASQPQTM